MIIVLIISVTVIPKETRSCCSMSLVEDERVVYIITENDDFLFKNQSQILLENKYFKQTVSLIRTRDFDRIDPSKCGAVILDSPQGMSHELITLLDENCVKLLITSDPSHLSIAIDNQFEWVEYPPAVDSVPGELTGIDRVVEALSARVWTSETTESNSESESDCDVETLESLMSQMMSLRGSSKDLSDADRRKQAEALASRFADLIGEGNSDDE
jgi:hypothetical protein